MSQEDIDTLKNASAIIERFGGIRPMASKVGAPVTTVQGWKKRDVIPGARRADIVKAAAENGIEINDLLDGAPAAPLAAATTVSTSTYTPPAARDDEDDSFENTDSPRITVEPIMRPQPRPLPSSLTTPIDTTHEDLMAAIARGQKKAVRASIWTGVCLIALVAGGAAFLLWPSAQKIERHEEQLATLEGKMGAIDQDVQSVNESAKFLKGMIPEDMQKTMADLRTQAQSIKTDVESAAKQAGDLSKVALAPNGTSFSDRLSVLEAKLADMEGGQALQDLAARIRGLEVSVAGQSQLSDSMAELTKIVDSLDGQVNELDGRLEQAQATPGSALGETLDGVSGSDMKAAALLIAFAQMRESLNRNVPFGEDLALLQKLVGNDDPALQAALQNLAPQAEKGGILTTQGLSDEFKGLAGDIVVASLKGEEISVTDKAKIRLTQMMNVKKDGELVGGTPTQKTVARAQTQLDQGDIEGALATLQTLDGSAKTAATPFMEQAQAALLADQVQNMLRQLIVANVGTNLSTAGGDGASTLKGMTEKVQSVILPNNVVKDEESGLVVLPAPKGFKGFSSGTPE